MTRLRSQSTFAGRARHGAEGKDKQVLRRGAQHRAPRKPGMTGAELAEAERLHDGGMSWAEVAAYLGRARSYVAQRVAYERAKRANGGRRWGPPARAADDGQNGTRRMRKCLRHGGLFLSMAPAIASATFAARRAPGRSPARGSRPAARGASAKRDSYDPA